jgi:hypothetical protein
MSSRCHEWSHFATRFCIGESECLCACVCVCVFVFSIALLALPAKIHFGELSACIGVRNFAAAAATRLICSAQLFVTQISPARDEMTQKYRFLIHIFD